MKTAEIDDIFLFEGKLVQVKWINDGKKSIGFMPLFAKPCECCGEIKRWDVIESSSNFQNNAEPIKTIKNK